MIKIIFGVFLAMVSATASASHKVVSSETLTLGIERPDAYMPLLSGKRVALVVNQASISHGRHTIDLLLGQKVHLVKLFALEHGIRGDAGAGEGVPDGTDPQTGLPIVSLYGAHFKPTPEMLSDVDVIAFDIQDVGVRFYTYISSLGLIMEAAAENRRQVMVFDRPNPNGDYVEGPVMRPNNFSFVGEFPIPVVYGLTIGELAKMIDGQKWKQTTGLNLVVVPMQGYQRSVIYIPEGIPSSGLKDIMAMRAYPSLALFEPTIMSVGKGTPHPYTMYGIPDEKIGPYTFIPQMIKSGVHPPYEGQTCYGEEFFSLEPEVIPRFTTDIYTKARKLVKRRPFETDKRFLQLLVGDNDVVEDILAGKSYRQIKTRFAKRLAAYTRLRKKYFLY